MLRAKAAVSFSTFFAMSFPASSATARPLPVTGWAAPMFEVGCMAATFAAIVTNAPAEAAWAAAGPTHTRIGTSLPSIARTTSRVASSMPPGVSSRIATASKPSAFARASDSSRWASSRRFWAPGMLSEPAAKAR